MKNYLQVAFVIVLSLAIGLLLIDGLVRETGARSHGPMMQDRGQEDQEDQEGQGHWMNQVDTEFFQQMHQRAEQRLEKLEGLVETVKNSSGDQKLEAMEKLLVDLASREKQRLRMISQPMQGKMPMMDQMPMMPGMMMQMRKNRGGKMRPHGGGRGPGRDQN